MLKSYLENLKFNFKKFAQDNDVYDIILYGSSVKGDAKPQDVDLMLIFSDKKLKERLEVSQKLKHMIKQEVEKADVKSINLSELFDSNFLARQGILLEGYSLLDKRRFSERLGFYGFSIFSYNLGNMSHNEKTKFTYSLIGRNSEGMLKKINGKTVGRGAFIIPIGNSNIFEEFLKNWKINHWRKDILLSSHDI